MRQKQPQLPARSRPPPESSAPRADRRAPAPLRYCRPPPAAPRHAAGEIVRWRAHSGRSSPATSTHRAAAPYRPGRRSGSPRPAAAARAARSARRSPNRRLQWSNPLRSSVALLCGRLRGLAGIHHIVGAQQVGVPIQRLARLAVHQKAHLLDQRKVCVEGSRGSSQWSASPARCRRGGGRQSCRAGSPPPACRRECAARGSGRRWREGRPARSTPQPRSGPCAPLRSFLPPASLPPQACRRAQPAVAAAGRAEIHRPPPGRSPADGRSLCRNTPRSAASARRARGPSSPSAARPRDPPE